MKTLTTLAIFLASALAASPAVLVIDGFAVPVAGQNVLRNTVGISTSLYTLGGANLLGGSRAMSLDVMSTTGSGAAAFANSVIADKLFYENGAEVDSLLDLEYNANGVGLAQDFSTFTDITFLMDSSDLNGVVTIEFWSNPNFTGPSAQLTVPIPPISIPDTLFSEPFSSFTLLGGFDFSDVDSIRFILDGPEAYDTVIHAIGVTNMVPESSPFLLGWAFVLSALITWRVRRS